jgi:hypothetical protein
MRFSSRETEHDEYWGEIKTIGNMTKMHYDAMVKKTFDFPLG